MTTTLQKFGRSGLLSKILFLAIRDMGRDGSIGRYVASGTEDVTNRHCNLEMESDGPGSVAAEFFKRFPTFNECVVRKSGKSDGKTIKRDDMSWR